MTTPANNSDRTIGLFTAAPGPQLLAVSALHGNEPAGIQASQRVLRRLEKGGLPFCGAFHAVIGNRAALRGGVRSLRQDLNRSFCEPAISTLRSKPAAALSLEDKEQLELLGLLDATGPKTTVLDLHTTSGDGAPFMFIGSGASALEISKVFPVPKVLGFEGIIRGTLAAYARERGFSSFSFEGGRHDDPKTIDRLEALIWLSLEATGCLPVGASPDRPRHLEVLSESVRNLPETVEICYRHALKQPELFKMRPGFSHFQSVTTEDIVADDETGEVRIPEKGILLLPLYQGHGDDGFFLARIVT